MSIIGKIQKVCIVVIVIYVFIYFFNKTFATDILKQQSETIGINAYLNEMNKYVENDYDINLNDVFENLINTDVGSVKSNIFSKVIDIFGKEFKINLTLIMKIMIIVVISSLLSNLSNSFGNSSVSNIGFFVAYLTIVLITMNSFNNILEIVKETLINTNSFMYSTIPIMITITMITGSITTANIFQPILLFLVQSINILINNIILPAILVFTVLNIVSNLTDKDQLSKLSRFIKSTTIWILGLSLTILVGIMSLEGTLSSSIDGVTGKTAKAALSTFIPVVGKILGDAVDTVLGCGIILKNTVGFIGVIIVVVMCLAPIIKIALLMGMYYLTSAVMQPIADIRVIKSITYIGDSLKLILGVLISVAFMYIISITLLIKISNFSIR